jgi:hypothetical protein
VMPQGEIKVSKNGAKKNAQKIKKIKKTVP